ncbi:MULTISPECIES: hypothetical protein [Streptomyces]|uniref:hypothetical protein n=1 Tax=Streptomyces TaxID=1883 RepID=UPI00053B7253|nr:MULTISPECIES: hypothetical protein [Streptomyces]RPK88505.1 hypothetical protein EES46_17620 [Streptomyces sp. ADI98-10]
MNVATIRWSAACDACGATLHCSGTQAVVGDRLRWDEEHRCAGCGSTVLVCGDTLPDHLRTRMLAEHGAARLALSDTTVRRLPILRVLRADRGLTLPEAQTLLELMVSGRHHGTGPEIDLLARRLRAVGVAAEAVRPHGASGGS